MLVLDESGATVADPDLKSGRLEERQRPVVHRYVVDVEEQSHEEVIAEYPETGGKDVEIVVDVEEQGHWETRLEDGELIEFDGVIPGDMPHELEVTDAQSYMLYTPYTDEELAEMARLEAERKRMEAEAAEREAFLSSAPARVEAAEAAQADTNDALCAVYEASLALQATVEDQDAAICALYEMTLGGE